MREDALLNEAQAARVLGVNDRTLRRWRKAGAVGFTLTPGGRVFYAPEDLHRLLASMRVLPTLGRTCPTMSGENGFGRT